MALPDRSEVIKRCEDVARRLNAAMAFSLLLTGLHEEEDEARQMLDEAQIALMENKEERKALERFAGRQALRRMREAEIGCNVLMRRLAARDQALSPAVLRRVVRRRAAGAPHELADLLGFYLHSARDSRWEADRVDKVDLLLTQLSQSLSESDLEPGGERLSQILATSHPTTHPEITDLERRGFERNLASIAAEVEAANSLGELIDSGTLRRYRELKHRLGHLLLHPELMTGIIETNQGLQRKIRRLNSRTLTGIFSIYQGIFERGIKGTLDEELRSEIDQLHLDFDRFERRVKEDEVKLTELEEFWGNLQSFSARLDEAAAKQPQAQEQEQAQERQMRAVMSEESPEDWLTEDLMALLDLLQESDTKGWPVEFVSFSPREEFQIDPREIEAFRRLGKEQDSDRPLEMFLLKAAALRRSIKKSARKLAGESDAETMRELPVYAIAQHAVKLAESFMARYSQAIEQAVLDGDVEEAQKLQILRMRLVRESAGIWLQVYQ